MSNLRRIAFSALLSSWSLPKVCNVDEQSGAPRKRPRWQHSMNEESDERLCQSALASLPDGIHDTGDQDRTDNDRGNASRLENGKLPELLRIKCHAPFVGGSRATALIWIMDNWRASDFPVHPGKCHQQRRCPYSPWREAMGSHLSSYHSPTADAQWLKLELIHHPAEGGIAGVIDHHPA